MTGHAQAGTGRPGILRALMMLALLLAMGITAKGALAGRLTDTAAGLPKASGTSSTSGTGARTGVAGSNSGTRGTNRPLIPQGDSTMSIEPSVDLNGTIPNPSSGDTVNTGDRFALDLMVHAGSD